MIRNSNIDCRQAQPFYFDYLTGQANPASQMEFEHIGQCPHCREEIKRLEREIETKSDSMDGRADMLTMHHRFLSEWIDCDIVKPFLASQAHPQLSLSTQTPVTAHIAQCQACRHDLQKLIALELSESQLVGAAQILSDESERSDSLNEPAAEVIKTIRNRKASGVVTRFQADDGGRPRVQVRHARQAVLSRRHLFVRFSAAVGILMVASLVVLMTTNVRGISIQDVYSAIHKIENCRIEVRDVDAQAPHQVLLICRTLNLALSQRKNETVILDFRNKRILKSTPQTGVVIEPSDSRIALTIDRPDFGLLPFDSITKIPSNYQWKQIENTSQNAEYEIYELSWTESSTVVGPIEMTWRGYLLRGSHLPVRIEWLEKRSDKPREVITETLIGYPDTQAVLKELQANSLYHLLEGDQIK